MEHKRVFSKRNIFKLNEKGLTLIELLAVIAILGIISVIAVISITRVIQDSKDRAFVGNALALKEAGHLFLKTEHINGNSPPNVITYQMLYDSGFLDEFKDPDTEEYLEPSDKTFVVVSGLSITAVCLRGKKRNLCSYQGVNSPVPVNKLSVKLIQNN